MEERYCQSCAMPLGATDELLGTEKDGTKNTDYCKYCYQNGEFTYQGDMQGMIDFCIAPMTQSDPGMTEAAARELLQNVMPQLKRWKQA